MSCLRCDDTGLICNICGESETACECSEADVKAFLELNRNMQHFEDCEECE